MKLTDDQKRLTLAVIHAVGYELPPDKTKHDEILSVVYRVYLLGERNQALSSRDAAQREVDRLHQVTEANRRFLEL